MILGVPTLNRYDLLGRLIASAEAGNCKPSAYFIVDNGGHFHGEASKMPGVAAAIERGAPIEVLAPDKNLGVAASWNAMLDRAGDAPLAIANDDVELGMDALEALSRALGAGHDFVIAEGPPGANGWCLFAQTAACTAKVGPYDENFFPAYYEDSDYDQRLLRAGIAVHREPATLTHDGWATMRADPTISAGQAKSAAYFRQKWGGMPGETLFQEPFNGSQAHRVDRTLDRDDAVRNEARNRFAHSAKSAIELFGARLEKIPWESDDGYAPASPSVLVLPTGRRLVSIRTVNYVITDPWEFPTIDGKPIHTKNWIVEMDESWRPKGRKPIVDETGLQHTDPVRGFEDLRLYLGPEGALCASSTVLDLGVGNSLCEMAILALEECSDRWAIRKARVVRDYEHDKNQKNWMPILGHPDVFVYLCDPTTVIHAAPGGTVERLRRTASLRQNLTELRGGSQLIPHQDGWISIIHEVIYAAAPTRYLYLHRFVKFSSRFEIQAVSELFYLERKGVEAVIGLARDGDRLVASYAVRDAQVGLAFFDVRAVDRILTPPPTAHEWSRYDMNRLERRATAARSRKNETTLPKICLCMIVKNEIAIIERCLTAALPFIDKWVITDTGSTDGTGEAIEQFFAEHKLPGKLAHAPFKNFAQARNASLEEARAFGAWDYALLIDADMVLRGSLAKLELTAPAYRLQQMTGALGYWNTRLVRRDAGASYAGVTHEFLSVPGDTPPNLDSLSIDDRNDGGSKSDKGERDIRLLSEGLVKEPNNERYLFYLAQTYREMGRHHEAIQRYTQRIAAGGWDEEIWASYYGIARSYAVLDDEPNLVRAAFDAYNYRPTRSEPLSLLARWWREHGKSDASLFLAEQVARIPRPGDILFVEQDVYDRKNEIDVSISGFYSKLPERRQAGHDTCARLTIDRDGNVRGEARKNFVHYMKSARELFGATIQLLDWHPDDGYAPMNPSVLVVGDRRLVLVRTVNYKVANGQYPTIDNSGIIRTKNWVLEMTESWQQAYGTLVVDATGLRRTNYPVEGFEDCRLYSSGDDFHASATVRDLGDGRCEQSMLRFDRDWKVVDVHVVRDYEHDKAQKNWMPILGQPGHFLYLCDPTTVIDCKPEKTVERFRITDLDENLTELRGGSQVIPHGDGFLCLVHEVAFTPERVYLHRFVRLTEKLEIRSVSEPFYFHTKGIEFAAGLARDGDRLVASFGVNDASAHLAFFAVDAVDRLL